MHQLWLPRNSKEYIDFIESHGHTDKDYLQAHFSRFIGTFRQFMNGWDRDSNAVVLDIGAHWLHQSMLFAKNGFKVIAADFPATMDEPVVQALGKKFNVDLLSYNEIISGKAFNSIPESSIDVVLFTEILEHITFNPVAFWKEVYRVLKPAARIVVTTPNYYAANGRAWDLKRFLKGFGGGITNEEILQTMTYGHHWKEYSLKEVCHYFCFLSEDFHIARALLVDNSFKEKKGWRRWSNIFLPQIYCEIRLLRKDNGIRVLPSW